MTSEYYAFDEEGKDNAARRTLFNSFIGLVAPESLDSELKPMMNIDLEQDRHFVGFRKSAGIWYDNGEKVVCWDRRLVIWLRAQSGSYLPFFDKDGELVTIHGRRLEEAAVCTLEVVLRNTACYSIGFLLVPKYKRHQVQCISKASSWIVVGYFPFPNENPRVPGVTKRVDGCEIDQEKIRALLLAHRPDHAKSSSREAEREGDLKPSSSVAGHKRMYSTPCMNQNKRRLIERKCEENKDFAKVEMEDSKVEKRDSEKKTEFVDTAASIFWNKGQQDVAPFCFMPSASEVNKEKMMDEKEEDSYFPSSSCEKCSMFDSDDGFYDYHHPSPDFEDFMVCRDEKDEKEEDSYIPRSSDDSSLPDTHLLPNLFPFLQCDSPVLSVDQHHEPDMMDGFSSSPRRSTSDTGFVDPPDLRDSLSPQQDPPSVFGYNFTF